MNVQSLLNYPLLSLLIPYLFTIFVYYVLKFFRLHKWRKIHLTAQISALGYVAGVVILVEALFDLFLLGYILILFILFLSIHLIVQWKKKGRPFVEDSARITAAHHVSAFFMYLHRFGCFVHNPIFCLTDGMKLKW